MMQDNLVIQVRWVNHWYHGDADWPPAPFRLHQALLDGAATGDSLPESALAILEVLEELAAPEILAPPAQHLRKRRLWVPNNDRDRIRGLSERIAKLRVAKDEVDLLIPEGCSVRYRWRGVESLDKSVLEKLVHSLYRLGRGIDMAWADCTWLSDAQWRELVAQHEQYDYLRPSDKGQGATVLRAPSSGSTSSLVTRHRARGEQFVGKKGVKQAPPATFDTVSYNADTDYLCLNMHLAADTDKNALVAESRCAELVTQIRDQLDMRLSPILERDELDRVLIGKHATESDKGRRLRIVPLPSTGQQHVRGIRRVAIERPDRCPIPLEDLVWAANGLEIAHPGPGSGPLILLTADKDKVFKRYGLGADQSSRRWQTITPVAIPGLQLNTPRETLNHRVAQALRHAGIRTKAKVRRLQREPFQANETASDEFANSERFKALDLWHMEIEFSRAVSGPLLIGNGRYLGLGLFRQLKRATTQVFTFEANAPLASQREPFLLALRRALMSREKQEYGNASVLFSGHERDGAVTRRGHHPHAFLCAEEREGRLHRVLVIPPWEGDQSAPSSENHSDRFERCCASLRYVNAGHLGRVELRSSATVATETTASSQTWRSLTPYQATRYPKKRQELAELIEYDLRLACARRGLPTPEVISITPEPRRGRPSAYVTIRFDSAIAGPVLLGGDSHRGGGHFIPAADSQ